MLPQWMTNTFYFSVCNVCIWSPWLQLWNAARWQELAFDKASGLRVIHIWSSHETLQHHTQGSINSLMVRYEINYETAFCHKIFSWWPDMHWFIKCVILNTMQEGSFVKCYDWPLFCIEWHFDNLHKIALQMIQNVLWTEAWYNCLITQRFHLIAVKFSDQICQT